MCHVNNAKYDVMSMSIVLSIEVQLQIVLDNTIDRKTMYIHLVLEYCFRSTSHQISDLLNCVVVSSFFLFKTELATLERSRQLLKILCVGSFISVNILHSFTKR